MKKVILSIIIFFTIDTFASDSIYIKSRVRIDKSAAFYNCTINPFIKLLDSTSNLPDFHLLDIELIISNNGTLEIKSKNGSIFFLVTKRTENLIRFQALDQKLAKATSLCNRNLYPYFIIIDSSSEILSICYDKSSVMRPDELVFTGIIKSKTIIKNR